MTGTHMQVTERCLGCGACLLTCPERAIRVSAVRSGVPLLVRSDLCTGCGECVEVCPADAIEEVTGEVIGEAGAL